MNAKKDKKIDSDIGSFVSTTSTTASDSDDSFFSTSTPASKSSDTDDSRNIDDILDKCNREIEGKQCFILQFNFFCLMSRIVSIKSRSPKGL